MKDSMRCVVISSSKATTSLRDARLLYRIATLPIRQSNFLPNLIMNPVVLLCFLRTFHSPLRLTAKSGKPLSYTFPYPPTVFLTATDALLPIFVSAAAAPSLDDTCLAMSHVSTLHLRSFSPRASAPGISLSISSNERSGGDSGFCALWGL